MTNRKQAQPVPERMPACALGLACLSMAIGALPLPAQAPATEIVLHNFQNPPKGANPYSSVYRDSAGSLYGTTLFGGTWGAGVVYKVDAAGRQSVLYAFTAGNDGGYPYGSVIPDGAGNFYGTALNYGITASGGIAFGVVYKLDAATGQETVLYGFTGGADGAYPTAGVIRDAAGNLYGTTSAGGAANAGVVFKLDAATGQETVLHSFTGGTDGGYPEGGVILDSAGDLFGTTAGGGAHGEGVVFMLDAAGHETVLHSFNGADGDDPQAGVIRDAAGNLYGTTYFGGAAGAGTVFKLDAAGKEAVLYSFTGGADGGNPQAGVIRDAAGNLYGTTLYGGGAGAGVVFKLDGAGNETVVYSFTTAADGANPYAGLIADPAGNLYGTTEYGGIGLGVVFEVNTAGQESVLYSFALGANGAEGAEPRGTLARDSDGNLFGATSNGGAADTGVVFSLGATGQAAVLYTFTGGADGGYPYDGVIRDTAGNLYGTTAYGGAAGAGVVFKVDATGGETVLYTFTGGADGANPYAGVILDSAGNLYGTTAYGGAAGGGVVFQLDAAGQETVLYSFTGGADGANPYASVVRDQAGDLFGTTYYGGTAGQGVVFQLNASGQETVLHTFTGGADGANPFGGVIRDSAGNLYGTTEFGGTGNSGIVFELDAAGQETLLHTFTGGADGGLPTAGVVRDAAGNLYGNTLLGGAAGAGVVFELNAAGQETVLHSFTGGDDGGYPFEAPLTLGTAGNLFGSAPSGGKENGGVVFALEIK
jgi:uncharacterized repeat protein (TIGR03803 family)